MLFLQSPKLRLSQQSIKNCKTSLSRTSYFLPIKKSKQSILFSKQDNSLREEETKKRKIAEEKEILSTQFYLTSFSLLESRYSSTSQYRVISLVELIKV